MALANELQSKVSMNWTCRLRERRSTDALRAAGERQQDRQEFLGETPVGRQVRLDQSERTSERRPVAVADSAQKSFDFKEMGAAFVNSFSSLESIIRGLIGARQPGSSGG